MKHGTNPNSNLAHWLLCGLFSLLCCCALGATYNLTVINSASQTYYLWREFSVNGGASWSQNDAGAYSANSTTTESATYSTELWRWLGSTVNTKSTAVTVYGPLQLSGDLTITVGQNTTFSYTLCNRNSSSTQNAKGYWKKNGTTVFTRLLLPGESYCYTFSDLTQGDTVEASFQLSEPDTIPTDDGGYTFTNIQIGAGSTTAQPGPGASPTTNNITFTPPNAYSNYLNEGSVTFTGTSTTAARDDTLKAGFNLLHNDFNDVKALLHMTGAGSNVVTLNVTNGLFGTNGLTDEQLRAMVGEYWAGQSNMVTIGVNGGESYLNNADVQSADATMDTYTAAIGSTAVQDSGGSVGSMQLDIGGGRTMDIGAAASSYPFAGLLRTVLIWVILLMLFSKCRAEFGDMLKQVFLTPQAGTAGTSALGTNANAAGAFAMAAVIAGIVVTTIAGLSGYVINIALAVGGGVGNPITQASQLGVYGQYVWTFLPLTYLVTSFLSYLGFGALKDAVATYGSTVVKFATGI